MNYRESPVEPRCPNSGSEHKPSMIWTQFEDKTLISIVEKYGKNWVKVEKEMHERGIGTKTGKQCRERWLHQLDPQIDKKEFTEAEMSKLFSMHRTMGNRWKDISNELPGRTDNMIKNFYYSTVRKEIKRIKSSLKTTSEYNILNFTKIIYFRLLRKMGLDVFQFSKVPIAQIGGELMEIREKQRKRSRPAVSSSPILIPNEIIPENNEERKHISTSQECPQLPIPLLPSTDRQQVPQIDQHLSADLSRSTSRPTMARSSSQTNPQGRVNASSFLPSFYQPMPIPLVLCYPYPLFPTQNQAYSYLNGFCPWAPANSPPFYPF